MPEDIWDAVVSTAKSILPAGVGFLTNAILPGTGVGGLAADLIADVLGVDPTPAAIEVGLRNATPDQIAAITKEAHRHKESLKELANKNEAVRLLDVQDARQRQIASEKASGKRDINMYIITYLFLSAFFTLVGFMILFDVPAANVGPVNQLFGALSAGMGSILGYWFGSSKSSADKTSLMAPRK